MPIRNPPYIDPMDFGYRRRSAEAYTLPRFMPASSQVLSNNVICAFLCDVLVRQPYTKVRFGTGSGTITSLTNFRIGVWDAAGATLLGQTADLSASIAASQTYDGVTTALVAITETSAGSMTLEAGVDYYVGVVARATAAPTIRSYAASTSLYLNNTQPMGGGQNAKQVVRSGTATDSAGASLAGSVVQSAATVAHIMHFDLMP